MVNLKKRIVFDFWISAKLYYHSLIAIVTRQYSFKEGRQHGTAQAADLEH